MPAIVIYRIALCPQKGCNFSPSSAHRIAPTRDGASAPSVTGQTRHSPPSIHCPGWSPASAPWAIPSLPWRAWQGRSGCDTWRRFPYTGLWRAPDGRCGGLSTLRRRAVRCAATVGVILEAVQHPSLQWCAERPLNRGHHSRVVMGDEGEGYPGSCSTASAADAMHIGVNRLRHIVVDDM